MMDRRWWFFIGGCGLALSLALGLAPLAAAQDGEPLDSSICAACHEDRVASFEANPHSLLNDPDWGEYGIEDGSCISCHAGAETHVEEGGGQGSIFAFGEGTTPQARTEACMSCHADTHPRFATSEHAQAGISCTDCHGIHQESVPPVALLKSGPMVTADPHDAVSRKSQMCAQCHGDVFAQFQFNERHRLQEGILDCTSCHNPHERWTRARLGGFKQDTCLECHTDKGGPFVFEHPANRVEGCVACHTPHGSPNRHLLNFQRVAELCLTCHAQVPGFHARFTPDTVCTNCHSSIHGSNFHPAFLQ